MNLNITLGHNSSAVLTDDNKIIVGYEEERLTEIKSDSNFPINAIKECLKYQTKTLKNINVSYWNNVIVHDKHWNDDFINNLLEVNVDCEFNFNPITHHEAHAYSSICFAKEYVENIDDFHALVVDGFGNNNDVLSLYKIEKDKPILTHNVRGLKNSLGLMYQFATEYSGMKPNQDEYKFLGYESMIKAEDAKSINYHVNKLSEKIIENLLENNIAYNNKKNFDIQEFSDAKENWFKIFKTISSFDNLELKRIKIGFFVQSVLEKTLCEFINKKNIKNILLSGGVFYNVKLNNAIMKQINGKICVMPLAGDQGCALGIDYMLNNNLRLGDLCFGKRQNMPKLKKCKTIDEIVSYIKEDKIVNFVTNNMEFGPRALCNTSSLCKPSSENSQLINKLNSRNEVMPMAPVMTRRFAESVFKKKQLDKVIGSDKFMIITFDYKTKYKNLLGVSHKYPLEYVYSGRPQIVEKGDFLYDVLIRLDEECLINTSFNIHGLPIVFTKEQAKYHFEEQIKTVKTNRVKLIIGDTND